MTALLVKQRLPRAIAKHSQVKSRTAAKFSGAVTSYELHANVQKRSANALFRQLNVQGAKVCLDLGAGPGVNLDKLKRHYDYVLPFDLSLGMLKQNNADKTAVCGDMDALPFQSESFDAVYSNFAVQWSANLNRLFTELMRILKPGGRVYLSCVCAGSLNEIITAFKTIDSQNHVNEFHSFEQTKQFIQHCGFIIENAELKCYQDTYPEPLHAMRSIKAIGATNIHSQNKRQGLLTKSALKKVCDGYPLIAGQAIVSYHVGLFSLQKRAITV
ncbi:methyltransferase domain-containing protein [Pseudoalteromonas shioyasakiensis]|uniref:methyltransferase domain-containing protein n=1 Tax=Pseudoalteromonas shioyasakiensis TaxID=1190813 RepID=UPI00211739D8|nr:methyltransferase domain-containing protein [Pseudoalteromonas shioyasakiensis]MCQ8876745.1 methyltransferase domain-containing protein [Pseudoalteromonas shioyasakiensis]